MADTRIPLDKLDPVAAWQPWQPTDKDPWGLKWAGHLYRRAAFGANPVELRTAVEAGPKATLDLIVKGGPDSESLTEARTDSGIDFARANDIEKLRAWWLYWMLKTRHPLREKMTLFWHNHFVSSFDKVARTILMFKQNRLLYEHALGRFGPFVMQVSKDAAMLAYLDSNSNLKGHPNENYGRELMELFTLGVGNYTEKDVREAARAFTGWHSDGDDFEFAPSLHDTDTKTVLGTTGPLDGGDVVKILLKQPACARFVIGKLYRFFISENESPPDGLLEPLAQQFRKSAYDIGALVRTMLSSRHFFSEYAYRQRIKSPVEFVVGAARTTVTVKMEDGKPFQPIPEQPLVTAIESTGQNLFAPPNVKGWRGGRHWLNTATMLARQNFGQSVAMGTAWQNYPLTDVDFAPAPPPIEVKEPNKAPQRPEEPPPARERDPAALLANTKNPRPEDVVRVLIDAYLPGGVSPEATTKLVAFVAKDKPEGAKMERRIRETVHAIIAMPEYQLA